MLILDNVEKVKLENRFNNEIDSEIICNEVDVVEFGELKNDVEFLDVNKCDILFLLDNVLIEIEEVVLVFIIVIEDDDLSDEYVLMKSNIVLFGVEFDLLCEEVCEIDVLKLNCESYSDLKKMVISEN